VTGLITGAGTGEDVWRPWLATRPSRPVRQLAAELATAVPGGASVTVVAAHPDDEVLGAGGLLSALAVLGCPLRFVWATDGDASHPRSARVPRDLGRRRREESRRALARLGVRVGGAGERWLGLPDSGVAAYASRLRAALAEEVAPGGVVLAPYDADGHPDHDAVGLPGVGVALGDAGRPSAALAEGGPGCARRLDGDRQAGRRRGVRVAGAAARPRPGRRGGAPAARARALRAGQRAVLPHG
jgi:LmbE family N-acetylglucosaminyl deacetylase